MRSVRRAASLAVCAALLACQPAVRSAVSLRMQVARSAPADASVFIDEEFIGSLGYVSAKGVRLPEGQHRITVEKPGYFPWDRLVVSDRDAILLQVDLEKIPD